MSKGFSLIEMLVVVGLVGLISLLAFSGLNNSINFNLKFNQKSESLNNLAFFNEILKRDLLQSINRLSIESRGNKLEHSFYGQNPGIEGNILSLNIINRTDLQNKGSLRHINYIYKNNKIIRVEYSHIDILEDTEVTKQILLDNVESLELTFGRDLDWFMEWPFTPWTENNGLPDSMKITLDIKNVGLIERNFLVSI